MVRRRTRSAFSLAEIALSILLVGGLLVVALNVVGDATIARQNMGDRNVGLLLAQDLLSEILPQSYQNPDGIPCWGIEPSEGTTTRAGFDDVDDYRGWSESPPQRKDGTVIPDRAGWRRRVTVVYVNPDNFNLVSAVHRGAKRITVTVEHNGAQVASLVAVRTAPSGWTVAELVGLDPTPITEPAVAEE